MAADTQEGFVRREDVAQLIADALTERDKTHAEELAKVRAVMPTAQIPMNGGGPGSDNHRPSWSLAEQEAAARGEDYPHWHDG